MSAHSTLGPSSAKRWISCPGSVALSAKAPKQRASVYAAQGSVAHMVAEKYVTGEYGYLELVAMIGRKVVQEGHEIEITEEMVDGAVEYHDVISADKRYMGANTGGKTAPVVGKAEVRICASSVDKELWGTADYILYRKGDVLYIYDYKFGQGVIVNPEENEQAAIYAIAVMDQEAGWAFDKVVIKIVQPRGDHEDGTVREWEAPIAWLKGFRDSLIPAVAATRTPGAAVVAGDWCRWCNAKAFCPVLSGAAQDVAKADFSVVPLEDGKSLVPRVGLMSNEQLGLALKWQDSVESFFVALKEAVKAKLEAGETVDGWKLVDGRSNRQWVSEDEVVARFAPVIGEDALYEQKLLSPSKLEKVLGGGKKGAAAVEGLWVKPPAKKSVAPDSDPRPQVSSQAKDDFGVVVETTAVKSQSDELMDELMGAEAAAPAKLREPIWPV